MTPIPDVSWPRIAAFMSQHSHDLRNELTGLDLEAVLLAEVVTDPEALEGVARIRAQIRKISGEMRALSGKIAKRSPILVRLPAQELLRLWQESTAKAREKPQVAWTSELGTERINVDPDTTSDALLELLANAHFFGTSGQLRGHAKVAGGDVVFELREPKAVPVEPARWGKEPFVSLRRGSYGLGLCCVVRLIEASGGKITWAFEEAARELVTTISFPIEREG